ncbi:MAG: hypothetical protein ORN26_01415 [Candidatus Pacebacteria bacterium]|nr:hypothetical protein [Candidatus Paceibacterota bacterium]
MSNNIFRVRINNKNNTSLNGNYIYSNNINTTPLSSPNNLIINNISSNSADLSFSAVNNAIGYNISINNSNASQFSPIGATTTVSSQFDAAHGASQAFNIETASVSPIPWVTVGAGGNGTG